MILLQKPMGRLRQRLLLRLLHRKVRRQQVLFLGAQNSQNLS